MISSFCEFFNLCFVHHTGKATFESFTYGNLRFWFSAEDITASAIYQDGDQAGISSDLQAKSVLCCERKKDCENAEYNIICKMSHILKYNSFMLKLPK
jgi:hypothetical protein